MPECPRCDDLRHLRQPDGRWVRCACVADVIAQTYIVPLLREEDATLPAEIWASPLLPFKTFVGHGDWRSFRLHAWHTLLAYEAEGLSYLAINASRLAEIQMNREEDQEGVASRRDLTATGLLILQISSVVSFNVLTTRTLTAVLDERTSDRRPTWVFTHVTGNTLARAVGPEAHARWFSQLVRFGGTSAPGHAPGEPVDSVLSGDDGHGPAVRAPRVPSHVAPGSPDTRYFR